MSEVSKINETTKQAGALAADKRRLLAQLLKEKGINTARTPVIPRRTEAGPAVLSFAQQRLWFLDQLQPGNIAYNLSKKIPLPGDTVIEALEQALSEIGRRHEVLRTRFRVVNGEPLQEVMPDTRVKLSVLDVSGGDSEERKAEAQQEILAMVERPFNLSEGPLFRATLLKMSDDESALILTMHHIISDGWSVNVLVQELTTLYYSFSKGLESPLPELPVQYADYAVWQRGRLQGELLEQELDYWKRQLEGAPNLLPLPTDRPRPAVFSHNGASYNFALSAGLSHKLGKLSRGEGATLFMTLLAAFQLLLARYSGEKDVVIGTPIAGRLRRETESLIGFFVNTLVLRAKIDEERSFRELIKEVKETALGAYQHQEVPFEKLVEELEPERSMSYTPLFQVMFSLQNNGPKVFMDLSDDYLKSLNRDSAAAKFDLNVTMVEAEQGLLGNFSYNTDLFDLETIERLTNHYRRLLEAICDEPDRPLWELPLLSDAERNQLLVEWNRTGQRFADDGQYIHEL
ncbi:MAG TPA: condensation domain-containing protein, partial [Pyrinomonadaceae bacterium]|nr:condensation domain-containing protein [Pyrinomonadaceae bacterium]